MSYSVICPSCNEKNIGSVFYCVKCQTNLIGIPRQETPPSKQEIVGRNQKKVNEETHIESIGSAIWRLSRISFFIYFLALLLTALVCFLCGWRTLTYFSNALFYAGGILAFIAYYIFRGSIGFFQSQLDPHNPMNKAMLGTFSARTDQFLRDYTQGVNAASTLGVSAALCVVSSFLIAIIES